MLKIRIWLYPLAVLGLLLNSLSSHAASSVFPEIIALPTGFGPVGIVRGYGTEFFVGSRADGSIYKGDLRTGAGSMLVAGTGAGNQALGLSFDDRTGYLYVAGGQSGYARVYDTSDGSLVAVYQLADSSTNPFVSDVVVTQAAAYFTDSFLNVLYRLPLSPNGDLPDSSATEVIPLGGEYVPVPPPQFGAIGIEATQSNDTLIITHANLGLVYRVDPQSGYASPVDLGGYRVDNAYGMYLSANTLYVAQPFFNQITVIKLASDLSSGVVSGIITSPGFDFPTTIDGFGKSLYTVNARFDIPPDPNVEYNLVKSTLH